MQFDEATPLVLVVDADEPSRMALCRDLAARGYRALCSDTLADAVRHLVRLPAIVVVSLESGATLAATHRFVNMLPRSATLIFTAHDEAAVRALGLPNIAFLQKPFDTDGFMAKVVESTRRRRRTR